MSTRRNVRLSLEPLDGRELPSTTLSPAPAPLATQAVVSASTVSTTPVQHYPHIRVAMLAYVGTPIGPVETDLLRNSVDLVIPNTRYLDQFDSLAPNTPQMIYTNVSNIYGELLADWLNFADRRGYSREGAFYHVTQATPFAGDSGSSNPVNWFWSVQRGSQAYGWTDLTRVSRQSVSPTVAFAQKGESVVIGYPEKFREINLDMRSAGSSSWSAVLEYSTARDSQGRPTGWKTLRTITDTTAGFKRTGTIAFDPPSDWRTAQVNGPEFLYQVRFRTTGTGIAPVAETILGRDYVKANGTTKGTIPAFDAQADRNRDGYLSNAEYAYRRAGFDARFAYESRLFYSAYGQQRFATNPANLGFRNWAVDFSKRFLAANPKADGLFVDNSFGRLQADPRGLLESTANYAENYATLLRNIDSAVGPKWVLANTAGSGTSADPLAKAGVSYIEEFALRPLAHNWQQFQDLSEQTARRFQLMGSKGIAVLDTLPTGGSPTDPRTQIASLAYYYLLGDPTRSFVMFNGGYEPATEWNRHWTAAVKYDIGKPKGVWSLFAEGKDPQRSYLDYKIYQRKYDRALVLYKPLSYWKGHTGTTANATATVHRLDGNYRELRADGTLGPVVNYVRLRNGEGAIMIRA